MRDTPLGQMLIETGREEGRAEGRQEGRLQEARSVVRAIGARRFARVPGWLGRWAEKQESLEALERAIGELVEAKDLAETQDRLQALSS